MCACACRIVCVCCVLYECAVRMERHGCTCRPDDEDVSASLNSSYGRRRPISHSPRRATNAMVMTPWLQSPASTFGLRGCPPTEVRKGHLSGAAFSTAACCWESLTMRGPLGAARRLPHAPCSCVDTEWSARRRQPFWRKQRVSRTPLQARRRDPAEQMERRDQLLITLRSTDTGEPLARVAA